MHQSLGGLEQGEQRHLRVGRGRGHGLELRGQFVGEHGDEAALKGGPAREPRCAHLARPPAKVIQRPLGRFLMGARLMGDDDAITRKKRQGARRLRHDDCEVARPAAFQDRMVPADQQRRPAGGVAGAAKAAR